MKRKKAFYKNRTVIIASSLCLVSVLGLAGVYRLESKKTKELDKQLVNWEETDTNEAKNQRNDNIREPELVERDGIRKDVANVENITMVSQEAVGMDVNANVSAQEAAEIDANENVTPQETVGEDAATVVAENAVNLNYKPENGMVWPVEGSVVLDYSMDQSIYFPTLEQYKYNPAIIIQSSVGTPVLAATSGVIESIEETDETGLTMTMDLGNGYKAVYGQLANILLSTGSYVEAGAQLGTVAEPTIYYQVEGENIYFQVLKDDVPQDPLDHIR